MFHDGICRHVPAHRPSPSPAARSPCAHSSELAPPPRAKGQVTTKLEPFSPGLSRALKGSQGLSALGQISLCSSPCAACRTQRKRRCSGRPLFTPNEYMRSTSTCQTQPQQNNLLQSMLQFVRFRPDLLAYASLPCNSLLHSSFSLLTCASKEGSV